MIPKLLKKKRGIKKLAELPLAYGQKDLATGYEFLSPAFISFTQAYPSDTLRSALLRLGEDAAPLVEKYDGLLKGEPFQLIYKHAPSKNSYLCQGSCMVDNAGKPASIMMVFIDVSQYMREQDKLQLENKKIKKELRSLHDILNTLPFPVWGRKEDLIIDYCNQAYSRLFEEKPEKIMAPDGLEISPTARALGQKSMEEKTPQEERRHMVVNGERKWYHFYENILPKAQGTVGYAYDITELENTEQELERHVSAHADLLESSASAMAIFGSDMHLQYYNNAFVNLWQIEERWLDTKPGYGELLEMLREKRRLPEQVNFQAFKQSHFKWFTNLLQPAEEFFYLPDGTTLRVIVIPHALGGLLFVYEDMTDKLALERSHNILLAVKRASLDNLFEGVAVFGEDGRMQLSNPVFGKIWGLSPEFLEQQPHLSEVLEKNRALFKPTREWADYKAELLAELSNRSPSSYIWHRMDGMVIHQSKIPLPDGAVLVACLDVTDSYRVEKTLRERNDALEHADELKSRFLASISYELRSPLTSIMGFTELLNHEYLGTLTAKQREYIQAIYRSSVQLKLLIDDILDIASIEAGYVTLEQAETSPTIMLQALLADNNLLLESKNIKAKTVLPLADEPLYCDETRLSQSLGNLFEWLISYMQENGALEMGIMHHVASPENIQGHHVEIYFKTSDILLAPEQILETLEDALDQAPTTNGRNLAMQGMQGLKLILAKHIIEMHGGSLQIRQAKNAVDQEDQSGIFVSCFLQRPQSSSVFTPQQILSHHTH